MSGSKFYSRTRTAWAPTASASSRPSVSTRRFRHRSDWRPCCSCSWYWPPPASWPAPGSPAWKHGPGTSTTVHTSIGILYRDVGQPGAQPGPCAIVGHAALSQVWLFILAPLLGLSAIAASSSTAISSPKKRSAASRTPPSILDGPARRPEIACGVPLVSLPICLSEPSAPIRPGWSTSPNCGGGLASTSCGRPPPDRSPPAAQAPSATGPEGRCPGRRRTHPGRGGWYLIERRRGRQTARLELSRCPSLAAPGSRFWARRTSSWTDPVLW